MEPLSDLIGQLCWGAEWEPHLNLKMSFGAPHLEITDPTPRHPARRIVMPRGEWWLWTLTGKWRLSAFAGGVVTELSDPASINAALRILNGQRLSSANVNGLGVTALKFDLGAELLIGPGVGEDLWTLYRAGSTATTLHPDGTYSTEPLASER